MRHLAPAAGNGYGRKTVPAAAPGCEGNGSAPMTRIVTWLIAIAGLGLWLLASGFVLFAAFVMREPTLIPARADGIVVLTGGDQRIGEGARLLQSGLGDRLLITGVNEHTRRKDIAGLKSLPEWQVRCCVDLGYEARNTVGNAEEAGAWARHQGFESLIIVTSSYHMPRSLVEMARELPRTRLVAHAVLPPSFRDGDWWLKPRTIRVLLSEYVKLFPATVRLGAQRALAFASGEDAASSPGSYTVRSQDPL